MNYRRLVTQYVRQLREVQDRGTPVRRRRPEAGNLDEEILRYIEQLPETPIVSHKMDRLKQICRCLRTSSKESILASMEISLKEVFPVKERTNNPVVQRRTGHLTRRQLRRQEYAMTQDRFKMNPTGCLRKILKVVEATENPPKDFMVNYWKNVMTTANHGSPGIDAPDHEIDPKRVWGNTNYIEIKAAFPENGTAPGPDGLRVKHLKNTPPAVLTRVLTSYSMLGNSRPTYKNQGPR